MANDLETLDLHAHESGLEGLLHNVLFRHYERCDPATGEGVEDRFGAQAVPPEEIYDVSDLDPKKYGIVVTSGFRRGLLLPDLEGVNTVEEQLKITKMKAGISPDEDVRIYRFEVTRYR